jgi:hypothetical protein
LNAFVLGLTPQALCRRALRALAAGSLSVIRHHKEHHQKISFRDEFMQFLRENGIEYDERFI